jgi:A/G-specific adenine glycosylase
VKAAKPPRRAEELTVFVLARDGRIALRRRGEAGLLAGLWEFPNVPGALDEAGAAARIADWGLTARSWRKRLTARHIFTHVEWRMTGYVLDVDGDGPPDLLWADAAALEDRAVPSAFAKYRVEAARALEGGGAAVSPAGPGEKNHPGR